MIDLEKDFGILKKTRELFSKCEKNCQENFLKVDEISENNQWKVMKAFSDNKVSEQHFVPSSGYGYDDLGRDTLDKVYAQIFGAEDAIVRHQMISGTHTISTALFGVLRPGDTLLAITGMPYDTLEPVIGIGGKKGDGSLMDFGVNFEAIDLKKDGFPDIEKIKERLKSSFVKVVEIQRSKGYRLRPSYSAKQIGELIGVVKSVSPDTICFVDNCYGEFVDLDEPTEYGADLMAGSLIKNPGGGIAPTGGYIAGKKKYVELCGYKLTTIGIGREAGASLGFNKSAYQGLFFAPSVVSSAVKCAILCACVLEELGYEVEPKYSQIRHDIVQTVELKTGENLVAFCGGIQKGSPVDSFVVPTPWDMPGYADKVVMAAGTFNQGASIEISADGPMREPFVGYMQGGLTYQSAKLGLMIAVQNILNINK